MRIISGKLKGRLLHSFNAPHIRPTTDRVKETLFNILMGKIEGSYVLDLFSGTGNLGIEAYSRGASSVMLVEENPKSIQIIRKNLDLLRISSDLNVTKKDAFIFLKQWKGDAFDVIFLDPPFTQSWAHTLLSYPYLQKVCRVGSLVCIESSSKERLDESYEGFDLYDLKKFGDKILSIWERSNGAKPSQEVIKND